DRYYGALGNFKLSPEGDIAFGDYVIWVPWKTNGAYEWRLAGKWIGDSDTIEWADWWLAAVK
ncbi:MAG: hypothetical protein QXW28_07255, partial [Nitrososphaerota archaeon]